MKYLSFFLLVAIPWWISAQTEDLSNDIRRIRKELISVQNERERVKEETKSDEDDFKAYRKRAHERMREIRTQTDSLNREIVRHQIVSDSLGSVIDYEKNRKKQYELRQESMRIALISAADSMITLAQNTPPSVSDKSLSSLNLLKTELETKAVDNIEGVNRLFQIIGTLHDAGSAIQIIQGSSPLPEIRGTVYHLRLGLIFEAVVNTKGTQAALWTGWDENGTAQWNSINDAAVASNILRGVNVREGKALPSLVEIPYDHITIEKESDETL